MFCEEALKAKCVVTDEGLLAKTHGYPNQRWKGQFFREKRVPGYSACQSFPPGKSFLPAKLTSRTGGLQRRKASRVKAGGEVKPRLRKLLHSHPPAPFCLNSISILLSYIVCDGDRPRSKQTDACETQQKGGAGSQSNSIPELHLKSVFCPPAFGCSRQGRKREKEELSKVFQGKGFAP